MDGTGSTGYIFFTFTLILLAVFFGLVYVAFRLYTLSKRKTERPETTKVGFVVDTFHELVSKLKEKEKELEVLRNAAEERADIIEDYNENILQSVPSGVISLDESRRVVKMNSQAEKILGINAADAMGKDCGVFFKELEELLTKGKDIERGDMRYAARSGKTLWLGFSLTPLLNRERKPIGKLFVFTDLTELKSLEAQAMLRRNLSSLGEMAAGIAHELRNPMGVIAGYAKLISKKTDESVRPTAEAIVKEVSSMDAIISDFLSFAKPKELNVSEVNVCEMVEDSLRSIVEGRGNIAAGVDVDKSLSFHGDKILLRQAFINLIQNAADAMPEGGRLSVSGNIKDGLFIISVSDTGHGIPEGMREKIFLPFYTTKERGTGLGLAIVHRIITLHGGSIDVETSAEGTTFTIKLPVKG